MVERLSEGLFSIFSGENINLNNYNKIYFTYKMILMKYLERQWPSGRMCDMKSKGCVFESCSGRVFVHLMNLVCRRLVTIKTAEGRRQWQTTPITSMPSKSSTLKMPTSIDTALKEEEIRNYDC